MLLLFVLIGPIVWGAVGLFRGRMPITAKHELLPPHLNRFAWTLILLPVSFCVLSATAVAIASHSFNYPIKDSFSILFFAVFGFMLVLAATLSKAKKYSTRILYTGGERVEIPVDRVQDSGPDFSNIDD